MYNSDNRLYLITRDDLSPGLQAAQAVHGAVEFSLQYPEITSQWHKDSNYVIVLSVPTLQHLHFMKDHLIAEGFPQIAYMHEPDIGDELTCIAIGPEAELGEILAPLPLALSQEVVV